jgi:hypothetical protein
MRVRELLHSLSILSCVSCLPSSRGPDKPDTCKGFEDLFNHADFGYHSQLRKKIEVANEKLLTITQLDKHPYPRPPQTSKIMADCVLPSNTTSKIVDKFTCIVMCYPGGNIPKMHDTIQTLLDRANNYTDVLEVRCSRTVCVADPLRCRTGDNFGVEWAVGHRARGRSRLARRL